MIKHPQVLLLLLLSMLAGCSEKGFYTGLQSSHQQACLRAPDREACLEGSDMSYEEYQSGRRQVTR
ncbi:hypothetical protein [Marinobacterium jannaschii]|uniref:hypothetical protein n=1 Tax=Marinobacterium jannaschii TaxID=64970 RepID=UPI00056275DE|nr:hypothetical protein [Marinobacterium jannaschii]